MLVPLLTVNFGESILEVVIKHEGSLPQKWVSFSLVPSTEVRWSSHPLLWWGLCESCICHTNQVWR